MATYTIELRKIIESKINIFDFDYPFYNEADKQYFEERFIEHFYFREIGFETVARFKHHLKDKLHEIAPYYNHYYKTTIYDYNPLLNYDVKENINRKLKSDNITSITRNNNVNDTTTSKRTNQTNGNEIGSNNQYDTPITPIANTRKTPSFISENNVNNNIQSNDNVESVNNSNINESVNNNGVNNTNEEHIRIMQGNIGVMATQDLIMKERAIITNINKLIFEELDELFMQVF